MHTFEYGLDVLGSKDRPAGVGGVGDNDGACFGVHQRLEMIQIDLP